MGLKAKLHSDAKLVPTDLNILKLLEIIKDNTYL